MRTILIILGVAAGIVVLVGGCSLGCSFRYSDGDRLGAITKFSKKGIVNKSWEGEMALAGLRSVGDAGGSAANLWQFTATDPAIVDRLKSAQLEARPVRVHYTQTLFHNPLKRDTSYTVDAVDEPSKGK